MLGNPDITASSRIHGIAIHKKLRELGYYSVVAYKPLFTEEEIPFSFSEHKKIESLICVGDIVVLQKIKSTANLSIIKYFKKLQLKIILIDCDLPISKEVGQLADTIICTSQILCNHYRAVGLQASYNEDSPELYHDNSNKEEKDKLECFWFGDGSYPKWNEVTKLKSIIGKVSDRWKLITISNHCQATRPWKLNSLEDLKNADAVVLPVLLDSENNSVKSANRLLQAMALSVPVVCSPLPSYVNVITHNKDGMICETETEWIEALRKLEDKTVRQQMGEEAYSTAKNYSLDILISSWIKELGIGENFKSNEVEKIITTETFLNNFFYRTLLRKNVNYFKLMKFSLPNTFCFIYSVFFQVIKKIQR